MSQQQQEPIPLSSLSLTDLNTIKQRTEEEMEHLRLSIETLSAVAEKFSQGREALESFTSEATGKRVLAPVTSSLYVPVLLSDTQRVTVDVGAKYYVVKSVPAAREYCARRIQAIRDNAAKVEQLLQNKQRLYEGVAVTIQQKAAAAK